MYLLRLHCCLHLAWLFDLAGTLTYNATGSPIDGVGRAARATEVALAADGAGEEDDEEKREETWLPHCPIHCACVKRVSSVSDRLLNTVDCTAASLKAMPANMSMSTQALVINSNRIHAEDVVGLDHYVNITELDISGNHMYTLDSLHLDMESLFYLLLDHNEIDYLPNKSFQSSPNLIFLSLVGNKIEIMDTEAFNSLMHLQTLDLSGNSIFDLDMSWFKDLSELKTLRLHDNNIHTIEFSIFKSLKSLHVLDLSQNHLKHIYPAAFAGIEILQELWLQDNNLISVPMKALRHFKALHVLDLSGNHMEKLERGEVHGMNVSSVLLSHLPYLLVVDKQAFSHLPLLERLDLSNNPSFMYLDREAFTSLPRLRTLLLHRNNLSTIEEDIVTSLPALTELSFHVNSPHCDCTLKWLIHEMIAHPRNLTFLSEGQPLSTKFSCISPPSLKGATLSDDRLHSLPSNCPPRILPLFHREVNTALGESLRFDCRATGIPHPQTDWLLPAHPNGQKTEDILVLKTGAREDEHIQVTVTGSLYIDYVHGTDNGQYTCLASNPQGRDERTAHVHVKNMLANVIVMRITDSAITVTWKSSQYTHDYQILYRRSHPNTTYHIVNIKPYMRTYTVSELNPQTSYEFCIAVQHGGRSVRINCTSIITREKTYLGLGLYNYRNYIIGGTIASVLVAFTLICTASHFIRKFNKRRRQQEELYSDNLSQLFLASIDSMSDTTPITYENRAAEMFDDDDIEEIRSTASMGSATSSIR